MQCGISLYACAVSWYNASPIPENIAGDGQGNHGSRSDVIAL